MSPTLSVSGETSLLSCSMRKSTGATGWFLSVWRGNASRPRSPIELTEFVDLDWPSPLVDPFPIAAFPPAASLGANPSSVPTRGLIALALWGSEEEAAASRGERAPGVKGRRIPTKCTTLWLSSESKIGSIRSSQWNGWCAFV